LVICPALMTVKRGVQSKTSIRLYKSLLLFKAGLFKSFKVRRDLLD
jgi:hypothetical protein